MGARTDPPGLLLQRLTTREPEPTMLECAIAALKPVLAADGIVVDRGVCAAANRPRRSRA